MKYSFIFLSVFVHVEQQICSLDCCDSTLKFSYVCVCMCTAHCALQQAQPKEETIRFSNQK